MIRAYLVDGNYSMWRAYSMVAKTKNPKHIEKNVCQMFLSMICGEAVTVKATHIMVSFDPGRSFRLDIYPEYKANRKKVEADVLEWKDPSTGEVSRLEVQSVAKMFVPPLRAMLKAAGLKSVRHKFLESDDVLGSLAHYLECQCVVGTRDKDLLACVNERVKVYWPSEKILMDILEVKNRYSVYPTQIRDLLSLMGDAVDNIPGIKGVSDLTARNWLNKFGSVKAMLKDDVVGEKLRGQIETLKLNRKLVSLRIEELPITLEDMVPRGFEVEALKEHIWKVPKSLDEFMNTQKMAKMKGLFK